MICKFYLFFKWITFDTNFKVITQFIFITFISLTVINCSSNQLTTPTRLRIAVLPDQSPANLQKQHNPLIEYLSTALSIPTELIIPEDYADLTRLFHEKKIDLAYFGGLTFVQARHNSNAVPLAMRDIDLHFTSYFLADKQHEGETIKDFQGKRFSFGSRLSTSGHLMPRYFLQEQGIIPEQFFSDVSYSGAHDKTAYNVLQGKTDLGVANKSVIESLFASGKLDSNAVTKIWITPPYPDYVWAIQPGFEKTFVDKLLNAMLALSPADTEHAAILHSQSCSGFLPARNQDFDKLDKIATELNLID